MKKNITLPVFGEINLDLINNLYFEEKIKINEVNVALCIDFEEKVYDEHTVELISFFLNNIEQYLTQVEPLIQQNFFKGGEVLEYIRWHIDEYDKKVLKELSKLDDINEKSLLSLLEFLFILIQPSNNHALVVFEYSIGRNITNHVFQICLDRNLKYNGISFAS